VTGIVLAVHGGAGRLARTNRGHPKRLVYENGLKEALQAGYAVLRKAGSSLNAVTKAVSVLEDIEVFNAGLGAALCADGSVELSASIMSGKDLSVGAMVGLSRAKNPICAARTIMGHAHGLLFGHHADAYAEAKGLDMVQPDYFFTRERLRQWEKYKASKKIALDHDEDSAHGTVGAVALDRRGNLAAATSTGGLVNQLPGRVGDTPVIGAGTWPH
jgi:beta-aspartyl-peptidase (threonine type)